MGKKLAAVLWLALVFSSSGLALYVKVISVNHKKRHITVLLPVHHATVEASLAEDEPEIRVKINEFYEADLAPGDVNTTRRNYLRIRIPDQKPAKFRLRKISFLE